MGKKKLVLLTGMALFFILFANMVFSLATVSILSGTYDDGATATAGGITYKFRVMNDLKLVDFDYGTNSVSVGEDACVDKDDYKFCVVGSIQFSHADTETKTHIYKASVKIEHVITTVEISRTFDKDTSPFVTIPIDDSVAIKTTIKNTGDTTATNINFEDSFSEQFSVSGVSGGCVLTDNKISWQGSLDMGQKQECEYKVKALSPKTYNSVAKVSYFNSYETKTAETSQSMVIPSYAFNPKFRLNVNSMDIGETAVLSMDLDNIQNTASAPVAIKIEMPKTANIRSKSKDFEFDGTFLALSKTIDAGISQNLSVEFSLDKSGSYMIPIIGNFDYSGKKVAISEKLSVNATVPSLEVKYDVDSVVLKSGDKTNIKISVKNPSNFEFRNLNVYAETDLPNLLIENKSFTTISPSSSVTFFEGEFKAPPVAAETTYSLKTFAKYRTGYNENFKISRDRPIIVRPGEGGNISETTPSAGTQTTNETARNPSVSNVSSNETNIVIDTTEKKTSWKLITIIIFVAAIIVLAVFIINVMKNQPQKKQTPSVKKENVFDKIKKMEAERRAKDELKKKMEVEARVKEEARKREESQRVEQQLAQKKAELKNIEKNIIQKKSAEQQQKPAEKPAEKKGFMKGLFSKTEKPKKEEQIDKSKLVRFK